MIITSLKRDRRGLTIDEISSRTKLNRMTVSTYLRELHAEKKITIRVLGTIKLHFWDFKKEKFDKEEERLSKETHPLRRRE